MGLHHCSKQVDRSFEVTDVHQFKDAEFVAATKEILREFVLDLKESWHEIRFLIWVSASSGILGSQRFRVASKDSIQGSSRFIKVHQSSSSFHSSKDLDQDNSQSLSWRQMLGTKTMDFRIEKVVPSLKTIERNPIRGYALHLEMTIQGSPW